MAERPHNWLATQLDSKAKLDIALFFHENPDTMDVAGSIATWTGYRESELQGVLDDLVSNGVLRRHGNVLQLTDDEQIRGELDQIAAYYQAARSAVDELVTRLQEDRARIAVELDDLEVSLDAIVQTMSDGLIVTDADDSVRLVNAAASTLLSLEDTGWRGRPALEVFAASPIEGLLRSVLGDREVRHQSELRIVEEGRSRYVRATVEPIATERAGFRGCVCVLSDITDLRRLDELKSELISFVSHELKAPLTAVKGYAGSLLMPSLDLGEETSEGFLRAIDAEADRLARMIDQFLDISKLDAGQPLQIVPVPCDAAQLVEQAISIQRAASSRCAPQAEIGAGVGALFADPDKVIQVLTNLLSNAVKYSPAGGRVTVRAERLHDATRVSISDEGLGMSEAQRQQLFVPYYRIKDSKRKSIRGTGLGLYLSKHLVEAHGGDMGCESEEGVGSTFWFTLPDTPPPMVFEEPANAD